MKHRKQQPSRANEVEDDWGLSRSLNDQYERYCRSPGGRSQDDERRLRIRRRPSKVMFD